MAGIECDIRPDGTLDLPEDCLAELDIVTASVHSAFDQTEREMTDRVIRAVESSAIDVIEHPTERLLLRHEPYRLNIEALVDSAAKHSVALEINAQIHRLALNDTHAKLARARDVKLVVSTDAHSPDSFDLLDWGVLVARRAWLEPNDVLNTYSVDRRRATLKQTTPIHSSRDGR